MEILKNYTLISVHNGWGGTNTETAYGPKKLMDSLDPITQGIQFSFLNFFANQKSVLPLEQPTQALYPLNGDGMLKRNDQVLFVSKNLYQVCFQELQNKNKLFVIGGDQSISIGTWSAVSDYLSTPWGLIWIDAHLDSHTFETSPSKAIHGMAAAVLLGHGDSSLRHLGKNIPKITPDRLVFIGARSFEEGEHKLLKNLGVKIYYQEEVNQRGFETVFKEAKDHVTRDNVSYGISFDIDAFDPLEAPATGTPAKNGLHSHEVLSTLRGLLIDEKLMAFELVEFNPKLDIDNKTLNLIWHLFYAIQDLNLEEKDLWKWQAKSI